MGTMTSETVTAEEAQSEVAEEKLVELIPVPDDDIAKHAKSKCVTCLGRGKISMRSPGSDKSRLIVCRCALKRFLLVNRDKLSVGRDRQLYYRNLPEGAVEAPAEPEVVEPREDASTGDGSVIPEPVTRGGEAGRLQVMRDRVKILDEKIEEVAGRYDRQVAPLVEDAEKAEEILARESKVSSDLRRRQMELIDQITSKSDEIARLEVSLDNARKNRALLEQKHEENVAQQVGETARIAPFARDLEAARAAVAELSRKRHRALSPHWQRRASLLKRMAHKAAGLGLSADVMAPAAEGASGDDRG